MKTIAVLDRHKQVGIVEIDSHGNVLSSEVIPRMVGKRFDWNNYVVVIEIGGYKEGEGEGSHKSQVTSHKSQVKRSKKFQVIT